MKKPACALPFPAENAERSPFDGIIRQVLERDQRTCQMCGADESCLCPYDQTKVRLFIRLVDFHTPCGQITPNNMKTICSTCAEGITEAILAGNMPFSEYAHRSNKGTRPKPDGLQLLDQIRRTAINDQKIVLEWLLRKFKLREETTGEAENQKRKAPDPSRRASSGATADSEVRAP